jgi:microcystin degradation protein MlrC
MRIAIGSIMQEVNSFNRVPTTLDDFEMQGISYGEEIIERFTDASFSEVAGFIKAAERHRDIQLVPTIWAYAIPGGPCDEETYQFLRTRTLSELKSKGKLDGILLAFHGSMSAIGEPDVEGVILEDIRAAYGDDMPVVISLDHHANVSRRMIHHVNALAAYKTQPHIDQVETGAKAAAIMYAAVKNMCAPVVRCRRIPMIAAGNMLTKGGPLGEFYEQAAAMESEKKVLDVSVCPGFPWADNPELGWCVAVTTDNEPELAQDMADRLAADIWKSRARFVKAEDKKSPAQAVVMALKTKGGPIVFSDAADSPNSGAPGDSTAILKELLGKELGGYALLSIVDPESVGSCIEAGIGNEITLSVGGKRDNINKPVQVTGTVKTISDGRYLTYETGHKRLTMNMKRIAVLEVGDIFILLSESRGLGHIPDLYRSLGLEPAEAKIVVVKSPYLFREFYDPFAKEIILVDAPGLRSSNFASIAELYGTPPRPIYPLDMDVEFSCSGRTVS